jgi:cell division transport system permease protein
MKARARRFGAAEKGLLPEGRFGPMPWVVAIMMFLTILAAAAGLALGGAAQRLAAQIGSRLTVQIVEANQRLRDSQAETALAALRSAPGVAEATRVGDDDIEALLEPWLGASALEADLPIPALIDVDLATRRPSDLERLQALLSPIAPAARIDDNGRWLAPLAGLIGALQWLAAGLVALMVGATAATVVLAARAALDTHRNTIEIRHMMGATDVQVARLFQRRIAIDALFGGIVGFILAALVMLAIGQRVSNLGSELLGSSALPVEAWAILLALPIFGVLLSMLVARLTILRALGRML